MITIFYRLGGKLLMSQSETELSKLSTKDVLWIDILAPTSEEKHSVDDFLGLVIQSRAQAEEIESSSRFSENERAIFANTNFLMPGPEDYTMEAVSFTFVDNCMTTLRDVPLRSFTELQRRIMAMPQGYVSGYSVFASIMDQRIDLDADMIELMTKEISQFSKRINQREDINEDFLLDINQLQENTMIVRENIVDKNFSFERLEYLQDTVVGLINLDQNNIMKIFTMVSVLLMPPTLVASFYGMNVFLPFGGWRFAWLAIVIFMLILVVFVIYIFKKKKMF